MSYLSPKRACATVLCLVAFGILLSPNQKPVCAQETERGVIRTFAVVSYAEGELPDFYSEHSIGLMMPPTGDIDPTFMEFTDYPLADPFYKSTVWQVRNAEHIMTGGFDDRQYAVWWLQTEDTPTPPPTGSMTISGPNSPFILDQTPVYPYCIESGKVRVYCTDPDNFSGKDGVIRVVTAVFSR
jgi:hypothetical protein